MSLKTMLGFAAVTAAASLAVTWPHTTYADGDAAQVTYTPEGTKIGDLIAKGRLVQDSRAKSGWVVIVTVDNRGSAAQSCALETDVTRRVSNPMARVMPMATTVWQEKETVTVAAHQKIQRRFEVPASLAAELTQKQRDDARPIAPNQMPRAVATYDVMFKRA